MNTKLVYQTDFQGWYVGDTMADESPLEPGVWHIPARCVELIPPAPEGNMRPRWNGQEWELVTLPEATTQAVTVTTETVPNTVIDSLLAKVEELQKQLIAVQAQAQEAANAVAALTVANENLQNQINPKTE